jgi:hypothetical protein
MAETIPGGAYLAADGKTWRDAEGKPISKEQIAAAKALIAEQTQAHEDDVQARLLQEANRDPVARALLQQQEAARTIKKAGA